MEKEKLESLIIDYIDNRLNAVDRQVVERELTTNNEAYKLYEELKEVIHLMERSSRIEPEASLRHSFDDMLRKEIASTPKAKTVPFRPVLYRVAAAVALLVIGGGIGFLVNYNQQKQIDAIAEEMNRTKSMMMGMLDNEQSASQRIQGVNVAYKIGKADAEMVRALVHTMNNDPNSNVRLAALEALSKFSDDGAVKQALIASLGRQTDPVVQIALIHLMVKMKEKSVVNDLQRIVDDQETMKAVKDEAYSGILKLS